MWMTMVCYLKHVIKLAQNKQCWGKPVGKNQLGLQGCENWQLKKKTDGETQ